MIDNRRTFLKVAGAALLPLATRRAAADDKPWLNYSIDLESFWGRAKFLERLKSLSDTGFKTYEFGRFKAKDFLAINKTARELDLSCSGFQVFQGLTDPKRKESFLASLDDALEVAELFEAKRLFIGVGELVKGPAEDRQIEAVIDALEAAAEKVKEKEVLLLVDPLQRGGSPAKRAAKSLKEAFEIVDEVNNDRVKLSIDFENGWDLGAKFFDGLKERKAKIGGFRISSSRLAATSKTGGLSPAELLKLIRDVAPSEPLSYELAAREQPAAAIASLQRSEREARA